MSILIGLIALVLALMLLVPYAVTTVRDDPRRDTRVLGVVAVAAIVALTAVLIGLVVALVNNDDFAAMFN